MATNPASLIFAADAFTRTRPLSVSLRLFAFGALLVFSFVPLPIFINVSQLFLLAFSLTALGCYLVRFEADVYGAFFLICCSAIAQAIGLVHFASSEKTYLTTFLFLTSLLIAPVVLMLARSIPADVRDRMVPRILHWVLVFLAIECVSRFIFSPHMQVSLQTDTSDAFYRYKSSLFFVDSNFVGIEILCLLALMFSYKDLLKRKQWILAYVLLFATLSRASIAAGICQLVIYKLWRWRVQAFFGMMAAQALGVVYLLHNYIHEGPQAMQAVDGSFSSKFLILSLMTRNYQQADGVQKLFGIGVGNTVNLIGIFAHNIVATCVLELGIAGSILLIVYVWLLSRKCPASIYLLILPIVINGFSLVSTSMPYFFVALGMLGALRGTARDGREFAGSKQSAATA